MIHVITGAPCSGKSTYILENRSEGDPVIDFDSLAYALGAESGHEANQDVTAIAHVARNAAVDWVLDNPVERDVWIVSCRPSDSEIELYREVDADIIEVDADMDTCLARAESDGRPEKTPEAIREWFDREKGTSMEISYKSFDIEEKDGGEIFAYAATFDREPDAYGDVIAKGAFARTIQEWKNSGKPIPLLFGHNAEDPFYNIGACYDFGENDIGFYIKGNYDPDNDLAQYVRKLANEGRLCKMSFAYVVRDSAEVTLEDGRKANELRDLDVFEVSVVTIPANQHAEIIETRNMTAEVKSGRRNSAKDEQRIRDAIAVLQELLNDIEPEEPKEVNPGEGEEPTEDNGAKALLEIIEKIGGRA